MLAQTVEYFKIPKGALLVICVGKSTYARCGIIVNVTPLEPEWEGHVTLGFQIQLITNKKYMLMRVLQFLFFHGHEICKKSYADRKGKYVFQKGYTTKALNG